MIEQIIMPYNKSLTGLRKLSISLKVMLKFGSHVHPKLEHNSIAL